MNSNCIIFYYINCDYIITVVLYINVDIVYTLTTEITLLKSKMNYCAICILLLCGLTLRVERKTYGNRSESLISTALVMSPDFEYKYFPASTNTTAGWKSNNFDKIAPLNQKHPTCFTILFSCKLVTSTLTLVHTSLNSHMPSVKKQPDGTREQHAAITAIHGTI